MIVLDANILLYAYNADVPHHAAAAKWVDRLFHSTESIALPWITLWAFLRISTNPRIWPNPRTTAEAFDIVREWLNQPGMTILNPGPRHCELLEMLATRFRMTGPLVTDAALAALAIENGAVLASTDRGFARISELKWLDPLHAS